MNTIPFVSIASTLLLLPSAIVLGVNMIRGIAVATYQLVTYFGYRPNDTESLDSKGTWYLIATAFTVGACIAALFVDFFMNNARNSQQRNVTCNGLTPSLVVSVYEECI